MKFHLVICLCMLFCGCMVGQTPNHPSVLGLTVQYKALPQSSLSVSQSTNAGIRAVPLATITLSNPSLVSSVNFKITNSSGAIEYESDFVLSSNQILDSFGRKIFQKTLNSILINVPKELLMGTYSFYVVTKDNVGNLSPQFILTQ